MNTLITILIVVMIIQSAIFTYSHFFDMKNNKLVETTLQAYVNNQKHLQDAIIAKDMAYGDLSKKYVELTKMQNTTVQYLPNIYQKEAMRQIINGEDEQHPECIDVLKEYYEWIKQLKYNDTEKPLNK